MKLKNILLGLAVFGATLSLTGCGYQETTPEELAKVIYNNNQKEAPNYTKVTVKEKCNDIEVEVGETANAFGITKESVIEMFKEQGIEEGKTIETVVEGDDIEDLRFIAKDTSENAILANLKSFTDPECYVRGDSFRLEFDMSENSSGMLMEMEVSTNFNEYNFVTKQHSDLTISMVSNNVLIFSISTDINITYTYTK